MKRTPLILFSAMILAAAGLLLSASPLQVPSGTWIATGAMNSARSGAAAVLLQDGRILITGGSGANGPANSAELFGSNGSFSLAPPMNVPRSGHVAVVLQDGRVLVAGGLTSGGAVTNTAEIFDPVASAWTSVTGGMVEARSGLTAALLHDGRVAIAGGNNGTLISSTVEVFNPTQSRFSAVGTMSSPRTQHAMTVLQDGRVLIVGGNNGTAPVASSDLFDPVAGRISAGPNLSVARFAHSATTLLNGLVVVIGGNNGNANSAQMDITPAELFDPTAATPAFTTLSSTLATPREGHLAFLLPNNNSVLIVGGTSGGTAVASSELFIPQQSTQGVWSYAFGATGAMSTARSSASGAANQVSSPSSVMQANGVLLVAGGNGASGTVLNSAELYGFATVQTDRGDYPPGTTVTITGSGWKPGEAVAIQLVESPLIDTHGPYSVTADANGNISDRSFTTDAHDANVKFTLTAIGSVSQAQMTFTDSPNFTISGAVDDDVTGIGISGATVSFYQSSSATCTAPSAWAPASATTASDGTYTATGTGNITTLCAVVTAPANYTASGAVAGTGSTVVSSTEISTPDGSAGGTSTGNNFFVHSTAAVETIAASSASISYSASAQNVPLTATVTSTDGTVNTGSVSFTVKNGATVIGTATSGNVTSGSVSVNYALPTQTAAQSYTIQASYNTGGGNSDVTDSSHQLTVSAAALTVTGITVNSKVYNGATTATLNTASAALVGVGSPDTVTLNASSYTANFSDKNVANGKAVTVTGLGLGGASAANYTLTQPTGLTGNITAAALTITAINRTKTFGQTVTFAGTEFTTSGLISPDTVTSVTLTSAGAAATATVAGSPYSIVPSAAVGSGLTNYTITYVNGTLTVIPALAFVRSAGASTRSGAFTVTISPTAGDFLAVVVMQIEGGADPSVMTDNKASVYTKDCDLTYNQGFGAGRRMTVYHLQNAPSGITTVNITVSANTRAIVAEYSGMPTSGTVLDVCGTVNNQTTGVTSWTSPATTTTASDVVLGIAETGYTSNAGYAAGSGWTGRQEQSNPPDGDDSYLEDKVGVAAGSYTATGTTKASAGESTVIIAYKATPATIAPTITSANSATFAVGTAGTFLVTATGTPAPILGETGALPTGVTFTPATGILSGTPAAGTAGTYPITITAQNGITPNATQSFMLTVNALVSGESCLASSNAWQNTAITSEAVPFQASYDDTPNTADMDGVTGLSLESATAYTSIAVITRFNTSGFIDARNGSNYAADVSVPYSPGLTYHFRLQINPATQTYTIFVTPPGSAEIALGTNYAFRTEQSGISSLNNWVLYSEVGSHQVCNFAVTADSQPVITSANNTTFTVGTAGTFLVTATGTPAPILGETGALPTGVTFTPATGILSGTPAVGTAGTYPITITAQNGITPNATQSFMLTVNALVSGESCLASSNAWQNTAITSEAVPFQASYDDTPNTADMDGVTGLSLESATAYTSIAVITRFNTSGFIDARNGSNYAADVSVPYSPGLTYHFRLQINPATQTYTIFVTPPGSAEIALGTNYAFRTEQSGISSLNNWVLHSEVGTHQVCNFLATADSQPVITSANNTTFTVGTPGTFAVTATGAPAPTLSETGALPTGVTFTPATGILSGTPAVGTAGTYPITITALNGVVSASMQNFTLTISPATLTYTANSASRMYGATNPVFTGTVTGFVGTDTLANATTGTATFTSTATMSSSVGSYAITGSGLTANNGNYTFAQAASNATALTITQATATVTVTGETFIYDGNPHAATATAVGVDGHTPVSGSFSFTYTPSGNSTAPTNVGTYSVTANFTSSDPNYSNATGSGSITITQATLTYTANPASRVYGATNPVFTGTVMGFVGTDTLANATTGTATFSSTATTSSSVGSYAITGSGLTANNGNYMFMQAASNATALTIMPAPQATPTVTVTGGTFTYDSNPHAATATAVGVDGITPVSGSFSFIYTPPGDSTVPTNVGTYSVTANFTSSDPNYTNATGSGSITITSSASTNVTLNNSNTVVAAFGSSSLSTPMSVAAGGSSTVAFATVWVDEASGVAGTTFNVTATYGGQAMTSAGATSYDYDYAPISSQVFYLVNPPTGVNTLVVTATASSGTIQEVVANLVSFNGVNQTTPVRPGTYQTLQSASGITVGSFTATISSNASDLTLGTLEQTYHFAVPASNQVVDGTGAADFAVGSDHSIIGAASVSDTWSFSNPYAYYAYVGFSIQAANGGGGPTLTYTANPASRVYGTANPVFTGTVTGFVGTDTLANATTGTATFSSTATTSSSVGSYAITGSGLTANNGNYTFMQAASNNTALTVTAATPTVTLTGGTFTYDGNSHAATATAVGVDGVTPVSGSFSFIYTPSGNSTAPTNVGTYSVTANFTSSDPNYSNATGSGSITITQATLTYTANPASRVYGTANPAFTGTVMGFVGTDTLANATTGTATFTSTATTSSSVGSYAITGSGLTANNGNYTFMQAASNTTALTITASATSTVTVTGGTFTYDGNPHAATATAVGVDGHTPVSGSFSFIYTPPGNSTAPTNVGTYSVTANFTSSDPNYSNATGSGSITITQATLTYTANPASRMYGVANPAFTGTVTGFVGTDTLANATTGTATFSSTATTSSSVGSYAITGSGLTANNGNYTFVQAASNTTALTITQATQTVTVTGGTFTYDGNPHAATATAVGVDGHTPVSGSFSFTYTPPGNSTAPTNVGTYSVTANFTSSDPNYSNATGSGSITITQATLTYTANPASRMYGVANPAFTGTVMGFVGTDTLANATTGTVTFTSTATTSSSVGSYAITGSGLTANNGNYTFMQAASNATALTITQATQTVTVTGGTFTYDGNPHAATATAVGVDGHTPVSGSFSFTYTPSGNSTAPTNVGTYSVTANFTSSDPNYSNATGSGSITITQATLTYTANPASRVYGAANPVFTGTVTGFVGTDTLANATTGTATFSSTATTSSSVGSYAITGSGLTANNGNYMFMQAASNATALTIMPAPQATPTVTVTGGTFTYDSNPHAATATAVGVDGITPVSGSFSFIYTPPGDSTVPTNVGTYSVTANFTSSDPNYTNATGSGSITITSSASTNVTLNNSNTVVAAFGSSSLSTPMSVAAGGSSTVAFATVWVDEASGVAGTTFNVTATYGGQAMTSVGATSYDYDYAPISSQVFYLVNPPTGVNTLVVTATASSGTIQEVVANLVSFNGVNQTTPVRPGTYQTLQSASGITVGSFTATISSNASDLTLGTLEQTYHFAVPASNQVVDGTGAADFAVGSDHSIIGAASVSDTWSFSNPYAYYAYVGFSIQATD